MLQMTSLLCTQMVTVQPVLLLSPQLQNTYARNIYLSTEKESIVKKISPNLLRAFNKSSLFSVLSTAFCRLIGARPDILAIYMQNTPSATLWAHQGVTIKALGGDAIFIPRKTARGSKRSTFTKLQESCHTFAFPYVFYIEGKQELGHTRYQTKFLIRVLLRCTSAIRTSMV